MSVEPRLTFSLIESSRRKGKPGQLARFEFSTETKKGKHHHGRRADVIFVA